MTFYLTRAVKARTERRAAAAAQGTQQLRRRKAQTWMDPHTHTACTVCTHIKGRAPSWPQLYWVNANLTSHVRRNCHISKPAQPGPRFVTNPAKSGLWSGCGRRRRDRRSRASSAVSAHGKTARMGKITAQPLRRRRRRNDDCQRRFSFSAAAAAAAARRGHIKRPET